MRNAGRHAGEAAVASVHVRRTEQAIEVEVIDDGAGFRPGPQTRGTGLLTMRDRVGSLGGTLTVESSPGAGTTVRARVPLR
jgi:signal transduction histidine kinase